MVDWDKKFKPEYDYAAGWLGDETGFASDWRPLVKKLKKLMGPDGFDSGSASALSDLRSLLAKGGSKSGLHKMTEDHHILDAVGAWDAKGAAQIADEPLMRAAALKLLRHVYLCNKSGNRKVWIVSLPTEFVRWPSDDLIVRGKSQIAARLLLRAHDEIFTEQQKKDMAAATKHALHWCQKTVNVLGAAATAADGKAGSKGVEALNIVKRFFADPATTLPDLKTYITRLSTGFKDIIATLGRGHLTLTDWVPLRAGTTQDEISFLNSEAFTFRSHGEGMDVVYIEQSFFKDFAGSVVHGVTNWTRVIVHELTHLVCGTEDVNIGKARYAWYGIGPHAGFPGSAAIRNADSWAFFCTDCAGQLTDPERKKALKII